jgi:hypothetical protein
MTKTLEIPFEHRLGVLSEMLMMTEFEGMALLAQRAWHLHQGIP